MCVFWSNLKAITKALPDSFHLCTAHAKQFLWREMLSKFQFSLAGHVLCICAFLTQVPSIRGLFTCGLGLRSSSDASAKVSLWVGVGGGGNLKDTFPLLWLSTHYFRTPSSSRLCPGPRSLSFGVPQQWDHLHICTNSPDSWAVCHSGEEEQGSPGAFSGLSLLYYLW